MRCPECGEPTVRDEGCPRCGTAVGYRMAAEVAPAATEVTSALDALSVPAPAGPLADFDLSASALDEVVAAAPAPARDGAVRSDLPLFPAGASAPVDPTPPRPVTPSPRPLGVRRRTPRVPKLRAERSPRATTSLSLELEPSEDAASGGPGTGVVARAPILKRVGAGLLDLIILATIDLGIIALTARLAGVAIDAATSLPLPPLLAFLFLLDAGYLVTLTMLGGQTIGKMVCGIRVVASDGTAVTARAAVVRSLALVASVAPVGLGFAGLLFGKGRALHDVVAETTVVRY